MDGKLKKLEEGDKPALVKGVLILKGYLKLLINLTEEE